MWKGREEKRGKERNTGYRILSKPRLSSRRVVCPRYGNRLWPCRNKTDEEGRERGKGFRFKELELRSVFDVGDVPDTEEGGRKEKKKLEWVRP